MFHNLPKHKVIKFTNNEGKEVLTVKCQYMWYCQNKKFNLN